MSESIKIVIPMAGYGSRLRPHTWSKPKPLVQLAGKTVLDYVLDQFRTVPDIDQAEFIFIVNDQGDQIKSHMDALHPEKKVHYVVQDEMLGQSDAIYRARKYLSGPMLMAFSDTLIDADLSFLKNETADGVVLVKPVLDPRRFGVAELDQDGWIKRLIEKPQDVNNNLVIIGFNYFRSGSALIEAIEEQFRQKITLKGEYFLADAVNILLQKQPHIRTHPIDIWLDAGTPDALFETNHYLLEHGHDNTAEASRREGVTVIPPVFIHPNASITSSVIGPYVAIGAGCELNNVIVGNSIIDSETVLSRLVLEDSLVGRRVTIHGAASRLNVGDNSSWSME